MKYNLPVELPDNTLCIMCPACRETGRSPYGSDSPWITFECTDLEEAIETVDHMPKRHKECRLEVDTELRVQPDLKDVQIRDLGGLVLELQQECCKFRALVERGASFGLDRCCCAGGFESCFSCACKEALK